MPFLTPRDRSFLQSVSELAYANPFLPERVEFERAALGDCFVTGEPVWSQRVHDPEQPRANVWRIVERLEALADQLQIRLREGVEARQADLVLYEDAVLHLLYQLLPPFLRGRFWTGRCAKRPCALALLQ